MRSRLLALTVTLPLGACAALGGGDPALYANLSDEDVALAARLMQQTLERAPDGTTRRWSNGQTGHGGTITPVKTYVTESGHFCRDYREELTLGGREQRYFHTACRTDDAHWLWI